MKRTPLKRKTPLKKVSRKQKTRLDKYMDARRAFIEELENYDSSLRCQVCSDLVCSGRSMVTLRVGTEVHHMKGRVGSLLWNQDFFLWVCRVHHDQIHQNPKEARKNGWLV